MRLARHEGVRHLPPVGALVFRKLSAPPPVFYISDISDVYDVRCVTSGGLHSAASALLLHLTN